MMWLFFSITFGRTHELLPCGLQWRKLVKLFKKPDSTFYWYDFTVRGERFRGSTKESNETRAAKIAGLKLAEAMEGTDPLPRRAPALKEFSREFLKWVNEARREEKTKIYYRSGWRLLSETELAGMRLDQITAAVVDRMNFPGSASNANCALRTLRRMLRQAEEKKLIRKAPKLRLAKELEREQRLDEASEKRLLAAAATCGWRPKSLQLFEDLVMLMRDTGMRNGRELYRMRIENIDWFTRSIFIPDSKTPEGRRIVPMSDRAVEILRRRCRDKKGVEKTTGWVFPARRKNTKAPYLRSITKHFAQARMKAGLPKNLVLYCGRHDFGTVITARTGNLKAVMKVMGHRDFKTAMRYQHPEVDVVRAALNQQREPVPQT
jgi:integrase